MTLTKLLQTLGIVLIFYAILSGFYFHYTSDANGSDFSSGYTFKIGTFLAGVVLVFLAKRIQKH